MKQRCFFLLLTAALLSLAPALALAGPAKTPQSKKALVAAAASKPAARKATTNSAANPPLRSMLRNIVLSRTLRVCVRSDIPPFGYFKGETLTGFDIALAKEIAMGLSIRYQSNIHPQWVVIKAADRIPNLQKNQCDLVVAAFSKTLQRSKVVSFSSIYHKTTKVVLSRKQNISSSPVVARVRKTTPGSFKVPNAVYSSFLSYSDILYTMRQNLVDYVITDQPIGLYLVRHSKGSYKVFKHLKNQAHYAIGVHKQHQHLLKEINTILAHLKSTGRLNFLRRQWMR